jgi:hypothetical protein
LMMFGASKYMIKDAGFLWNFHPTLEECWAWWLL